MFDKFSAIELVALDNAITHSILRGRSNPDSFSAMYMDTLHKLNAFLQAEFAKREHELAVANAK